MGYNFDEVIDRRVTPSLKWRRFPEDVLPLWVADMDFRSPEPVRRALQARIEHGIFGYEYPPRELRRQIVARLKRLYDWDVTKEAIVFLPGVVPGFHFAIRSLTAPGDGVFIQTPVYPPILHAAEENGRRTRAMQLTRKPDGYYEVDFDLFEQKVREQTKMFLLCNPHNPVGRVFRKDELERMAELCLEHDVIICSDEIHGDLIFSGHHHIPIASLSPEIANRTITLMAPSKTYNIAGLHCSYAVIPNEALRQAYTASMGGIRGSNVLGYTAALAAYKEGDPWLKEALRYMEANRDYAIAYLHEHLPAIHVAPPEGTFLLWLDCREAVDGNPHQALLERGKVALNDGATFGPGGEGFVRLNVGCPRALLEEGLRRMESALR